MEDDFIGVLVQHSPAILEKYRARVEEYLYMVSSVKNTEIANAIKYHFGWLDQEGNATSSMQGKGIRSSLCMFACESVGGVLDNALQGAAAVELVHNFSLVHDDIQDQDEDINIIMISEKNGAVGAIATHLFNRCFCRNNVQDIELWSLVRAFGCASVHKHTKKFFLQEKLKD